MVNVNGGGILTQIFRYSSKGREGGNLYIPRNIEDKNIQTGKSYKAKHIHDQLQTYIWVFFPHARARQGAADRSKKNTGFNLVRMMLNAYNMIPAFLKVVVGKRKESN